MRASLNYLDFFTGIFDLHLGQGDSGYKCNQPDRGVGFE